MIETNTLTSPQVRVSSFPIPLLVRIIVRTFRFPAHDQRSPQARITRAGLPESGAITLQNLDETE